MKNLLVRTNFYRSWAGGPVIIVRGLHLNMITHKLYTKNCNSSKTQFNWNPFSNISIMWGEQLYCVCKHFLLLFKVSGIWVEK